MVFEGRQRIPVPTGSGRMSMESGFWAAEGKLFAATGRMDQPANRAARLRGMRFSRLKPIKRSQILNAYHHSDTEERTCGERHQKPRFIDVHSRFLCASVVNLLG